MSKRALTRRRFVATSTAAGASLITQFMFIPYYPFWSIAVMTLDFLAIWTLIRFRVA